LTDLRAQRFDAINTVDKNLRHQQNLQTLPIAVVVLSAKSNSLRGLYRYWESWRGRLLRWPTRLS
jgi:hypothetical protein